MRADLPSARAAAYLNAGTFGPLPEPAHRVMREHLDGVLGRGRIGPQGLQEWMGFTDGARAAFARSVQAAPETIALTHSTTDGVNLVVWGLDFQPGDVVVTTTSEHPGLTEPLETLARRRGVVLRTVDVEGLDATAAVTGAIDEQTRLVALSHVLWTDGTVLDVPAIGAACRAAGVPLLVDGAQGAGCVVVEADALGADFYTISGQKWLCGPSGTGALYVRPERLEQLQPAWPWYLTRDRHSGPEAVLWPAARRFDAGSITLTALAGAAAAIEWRTGTHDLAAGVERADALAARLREALADLPGVEPVPVAAPSSLVSFAVPGDPNELVVALAERGVLVRSVPGRPWLRASVGPWNVEGDLDRLVEGVRAGV
jgi:L-cysteine/cystine lyase